MLEHNGDFAAANRALSDMGYGPQNSIVNDVDLSGLLAKFGLSTDGSIKTTGQLLNGQFEHLSGHPNNHLPLSIIDRFEPKTLTERFVEYNGLNKPVIHGLLREGETMNIIASPKVGKSWLSSNLGICVAGGLDWMGLNVEQGSVLHIDNELHENTGTYRYGVVSEAMGVEKHLYNDNLTTICL
ncbi:MAG: AAA family ATPase, partial [Planctomycetes bacterium]|nr:AAA family ATPase [Planctomycetota bacterium]